MGWKYLIIYSSLMVWQNTNEMVLMATYRTPVSDAMALSRQFANGVGPYRMNGMDVIDTRTDEVVAHAQLTRNGVELTTTEPNPELVRAIAQASQRQPDPASMTPEEQRAMQEGLQAAGTPVAAQPAAGNAYGREVQPQRTQEAGFSFDSTQYPWVVEELQRHGYRVDADYTIRNLFDAPVGSIVSASGQLQVQAEQGRGLSLGRFRHVSEDMGRALQQAAVQAAPQSGQELAPPARPQAPSYGREVDAPVIRPPPQPESIQDLLDHGGQLIGAPLLRSFLSHLPQGYSEGPRVEAEDGVYIFHIGVNDRRDSAATVCMNPDGSGCISFNNNPNGRELSRSFDHALSRELHTLARDVFNDETRGIAPSVPSENVPSSSNQHTVTLSGQQFDELMRGLPRNYTGDWSRRGGASDREDERTVTIRNSEGRDVALITTTPNRFNSHEVGTARITLLDRDDSYFNTALYGRPRREPAVPVY